MPVEMADWEIKQQAGKPVLYPSGDWTAVAMGDAMRKVALLGETAKPVRSIDFTEVGRVDTTGALGLLQLMAADSVPDCGERDDIDRLFALIRAPDEPNLTSRGRPAFFERFGEQIVGLVTDVYAILSFTGHMMTALGRCLLRVHRLRVTPVIAMMQDTGINALPIAFIMTFFIGAVIALVGTNLLTTLGVEVFTVELVGVAVFREFGLVIAAILLAGRSASSFAAQLGSMRMNQETDAMQVMGIDRFEALVVPRVIAGIVMMPFVTYVADMGGIVGGMVVSWITIDLNPAFFFQRLTDMVSTTHFWIGIGKAPFMGLVVAGAGCRHGMMVGGDVQSLGKHVTSAVVQSIFMIIMFDALFAAIFMVLDL